MVCVVVYAFLNGGLHFSGEDRGGEIFGGIVAAFIGFYAGYRIRMRGFVDSVKMIREIADKSTLSAGRSLYVQMINDRMHTAQAIVDGFQHDTYEAGSPEEFQGWVDAFFRLGGGDYIAVDSHPPSRYWRDYAWFLDAHARSLRERRASGEEVDDVRVLSVSQTDLDDDFFDEARLPDYQRFVRWHKENDVELRLISPDALSAIREQFELTATDDVALWLNFAALFTPADLRSSGSGVSIKLRVKGDDDVTPTYEVLDEVMAAVRDRSQLMSEAPPGVEMGDRQLATRWNDYLGPDLRWIERGAYEQFMAEVVPQGASVFDAAAGTGVDSVNLLVRGYSVVSNEVDPRLADAARDYAQRRGVDIELKTARWEQLTLAGNPRFDVVLVLGNSLCLVTADDRRRKALEEFHRVLRPGGCLVIDERNFEFMRKNRSEILSDPYRAWITTFNDVMYPCKDVLGFPSSVNASQVMWSFLDNTPAVGTTSEVRARASKYQPLRLYAFQYGELFRQLSQVGFKVTAIYADLNRVASDDEGVTMPSYEVTGKAGFITYVAKRPR